MEDSLKTMVKGLGEEEGVEVRRESFDEAVEEGGMYSATSEVGLDFQDFKTYIQMTMKYGPSAIEVSGPRELELPSGEYLSAVGEAIRVARDIFERHGAEYKFSKSDKEARIGLSEEEIEGFLDQGALRVKIVVEGRGRSEEEAVRDLVNAVKEDLFINKAKAHAMEEGEGFSGLIGIEAFMYEARTLFHIATALTPVLVEIMEPEEIRLSVLDIQDIGVDLAGVFFELAHTLEAMKRARANRR